MKAGILLVEDEASIAKALKAGLEFEGYAFWWAPGIEKAKEILYKNSDSIHIILLDVMLPDGEGFDAFHEFKKIHPSVKILFTTARIESADKVKGLRLGADDYITKPYDLDEIILRLERLKSDFFPKKLPEIFQFPGGTINFEKYKVWNASNECFHLGAKEMKVLQYLIMNRGKTLSREDIYNACWNDNESGSLRSIDNFILNFRKIFEDIPSEPKFFHSVRGVGYRFEI